jgi:hypothetical protein
MNVFRVCVLYVYASTYDCVLEIGLEAYLQPCVRRRRTCHADNVLEIGKAR